LARKAVWICHSLQTTFRHDMQAACHIPTAQECVYSWCHSPPCRANRIGCVVIRLRIIASRFEPCDLAINVPSSFPQVFKPIAFAARSPEIFDCVPDVERKPFRDLDALGTAGMACVVIGMVYGVVGHDFVSSLSIAVAMSSSAISTL